MSEDVYEAITRLFVQSKQGTSLKPEQIAALLDQKQLVHTGRGSTVKPNEILAALAYGLKNEEFFRFDIRIKYLNPNSRKNPPAAFTMDGKPLKLKQIKQVNAVEKKYENAKHKKRD